MTTLLEHAERTIFIAVLCGALGAFVVAARNDLPPVQHPVPFVAVFWAVLAVAYLVVIALVEGASAASRRWAAAASWGPWIPAGALLAWFATLVTKHGPAIDAAARPWMPGGRGTMAVATFVCLAVAALLAALPRISPAIRRLVCLTAIALAVASVRTTTPAHALDLSAALRTVPLVVVGVDGADWNHLEPLMAAGQLPRFSALRERGAWGPLATIRPTLSPPIWTSIVTGHRPNRHGVASFTFEKLLNVEAPFHLAHSVAWTGWPLVEQVLRARGAIRVEPVGSAARQVPAYWEIASAAGQPTVVVSWWATWPADRILGSMVSDRVYYQALVGEDPVGSGSVHPSSLLAGRQALVRRPESVTYEEARAFLEVTPEEYEPMRSVRHPSPLTGIAHELTYIVSLFETARGLAVSLTATGSREPPDLLVLFRIVDQACHTALHYSPLVEDHLGTPDDERRRFGPVVEGAYRAVDRALGDILERYPQANILVVSDHGFRLEGSGDARGYNHNTAPDGVFLAAGPDVRTGRVDGLGIYDVLPLMLYLKGIPLSREFGANGWKKVVDPVLLASLPPSTVTGYGDRAQRLVFRRSERADAEVLERLRALGYLK